MQNFSYIKLSTPEEAATHLRVGLARVVGGGTDIIPLMKEEIATPETLVDISLWEAGREISASDNGVDIGALVTLNEIADNDDIREHFTALADACSLSAAPQLRNMGTIGGNLLQATRCWYYRGPYNCWLKGGDHCYARDGENEGHSIFLTSPKESPCVSASPSDPATALLALDATVMYTAADGAGELPLSKIYRLPTNDQRTMVSLPPDAVITGVRVPATSARSIYRKAMSRATWTFALAGVAIALDMHESKIVNARMALGGVAPFPFRASGVEAALTGADTRSLDMTALVHLLVDGAQPLSQNAYKVTLLGGLFREAVEDLLADH